MIANAMEGKASRPSAVLDETVLDALGWLQGKQDAEFVARLITMYLETALVLLVRLKEGVVHDDISALHHASHALKSAVRRSVLIPLPSSANGWNRLPETGKCRITQFPGSNPSASNIGGSRPH